MNYVPLNFPANTFDAPWKEALMRYFEEFMGFYFQDIHAAIDWSQPCDFLNQELQQLSSHAMLDRRLADLLVRVHARDGAAELIHLEVQTFRDAGLAERMFVYNYRIFDRYRLPVASLLLLADRAPDWRPAAFSYRRFGSETSLHYRLAKVQDYASRLDDLLADANPFGLVTAAHFLSLQTRRSPVRRYKAKTLILTILLARGWRKERIIDLFHIIDWLMRLPDRLEDRLWQKIGIQEGGKAMENYIPRGARIQLQREFREIQQRGWEQGIEKGLKQGLEQGLEQGARSGQIALLSLQIAKRFGQLPASAQARIAEASPAQLAHWAEAILDAPSLDDMFRR